MQAPNEGKGISKDKVRKVTLGLMGRHKFPREDF